MFSGKAKSTLSYQFQKEIDELHIIGVSMGALIAQHFALMHPEKTLSLTTLGGYNINEANKDVAKSQQKEMFGWIIQTCIEAIRGY